MALKQTQIRDGEKDTPVSEKFLFLGLTTELLSAKLSAAASVCCLTDGHEGERKRNKKKKERMYGAR